MVHCFFFKQKTAYEMRISDWSSDVCSSDLHHHADELLVLVMMVEGEFDQPLQRLDRRQALGVELRLAFAHQPVGVLEGAQIEALLFAEIVIDHALAGARARGDLVDARAGQDRKSTRLNSSH